MGNEPKRNLGGSRRIDAEGSGKAQFAWQTRSLNKRMRNAIAPVSAVIAAYNAEEFIAETIASAQAQTLPVAKIIVVADGSTDATAQIAESMRARVFHEDRPGLSAARNKCV